jgi:hypothetical protein
VSDQEVHRLALQEYVWGVWHMGQKKNADLPAAWPVAE